MEVTLEIPNVLLYLLTGVKPISEDKAEVIGDSRLAYLGEDHPFTQAARWHDQLYLTDYRAKNNITMSRLEVDIHFLNAMLSYTFGDEQLVKEALMLFMFVRKFGTDWWED